MARKLLIPLSAALVGALITASPALAVTTDCDGLQQALDDATDGTTVTLVSSTPCTGSYNLPSSTDLVLEGGGDGATLGGDGESRLLEGSNVGDTVIRNLRFEGGRTGGSGAAIYIGGYEDSLTIEDNEFSDNDSGSSGGAVFIESQQLTLEQDAARTTQGDDGLGGGVTIARNVFGDGEGNRSGQGGGALGLYVLDTVTLTGNVFEGNEAHGFGGGADVSFCEKATIADNTFEDNNVIGTGNNAGRVGASEPIGGSAAGGGLWIASNWCFFFPPEQRGSEGRPPEAVIEQSGNDFVANSLTTGGGGTAEGGGEYVRDATLESTSDVFHANAIGAGSTGYGGGLFIDSVADTTLHNFVATANTIQGGDGGAVRYDGADTTLSVVHATIASNSIGEGFGSAILGDQGQTLLVDNSIVHGNTGGPELSGFEQPEAASRDTAGALPGGIEVDFSLVCDPEGQTWEGEGNLCLDPKLTNAAGGDVHQTASSPTLERASADLMAGLEKDYEGDTRPLDYDRKDGAQPDMGADEAPAPPEPTPTTQQQTTPPASGGVLGTQARSCTSRRSFRIKLRNHGQKVVKATVIVNGKRVKVLRGKRLTSRVDLRGLPKGRFTVRIKLQLANGKTISGVRRYYTCRPGRPSGPPPV